MASIVKIKRSAVQGKAPTPSDLQLGEIALNTRDGKLFSSDGSSVFEIGSNNVTSTIGTLTVGNTNPFTLPTSDGSSGQVLTTDGSGAVSWSDSTIQETFNSYSFTTTNGQTVFTGTDDFGQTLSHNTTNVGGVYLNGVLLKANTDYTYSTSNRITLTESASGNNLVTIQTFGSTTNFVNVNAVITTNTHTTTAVSEEVVDSWGTGDYRSAKYIIQMTNNANSTYQTSEVMVLHDGSSTYLTEYGIVKSLNTLGSIDSDISSGSVRLKVTPINADTTIKVIRSSITV